MAAWSQILQIVVNSTLFYLSFDTHDSTVLQLSVTMMNWVQVWVDLTVYKHIQRFLILFAEISQIILKIYFIPILLTFTYLVALYQKTEL